MKVLFKDIPPGGLRRSIGGGGWLSENQFEYVGKPQAELTLELEDEVTALLDGSMTVSLKTVCSRCCCELIHEIEGMYSYRFCIGEDATIAEREIEFNTQECNTVYLDEPVVDIFEVLQEQLFLAIPEKLLCSERCKGLCQKCGARLNIESCKCTGGNPDSPFAVLQKLKK